MSDKEINKEAFKQAQQELLESKVKEIKGYILKTLEKLETKKKDKNKIEEEIRILKLDLDDFRKGNFEKIEERLEKSKVARGVSVIDLIHFHSSSPYIGNFISGDCTNGASCTTLGTNGTVWATYTAGTYPLSDGKVIYLN